MNGPFLLDTHALYWAVQNSSKLSANALRAVQTGPLVASVASHWEIITKFGIRGLPISDPITWWDRAITFLRADVLSIRADHVAAVHALPVIHKDPFDRILIAQASVEGMALLTSDANIWRYPGRIYW